MQTLGAFMAALTFAWFLHRGAALAELASHGVRPLPLWVYYWIRFGVPAAILTVGIWWLMTSVLGVTAAE
jgi:hypothetical protein